METTATANKILTPSSQKVYRSSEKKYSTTISITAAIIKMMSIWSLRASFRISKKDLVFFFLYVLLPNLYKFFATIWLVSPLSGSELNSELNLNFTCQKMLDSFVFEEFNLVGTVALLRAFRQIGLNDIEPNIVSHFIGYLGIHMRKGFNFK